jgi:hypothetical protein
MNTHLKALNKQTAALIQNNSSQPTPQITGNTITIQPSEQIKQEQSTIIQITEPELSVFV